MEKSESSIHSGVPALSDLFSGGSDHASRRGGSHHPTERPQRLGAPHAPKRIGRAVQVAPRKQNKK